MTEPGLVVRELQRLWQQRRQPSSRAISRWSAGAVSHTAVNRILTGQQPAFRWETVEAIAVALSGDAKRIGELWDAEFGINNRVKPEEPPTGERASVAAMNRLADAIDNLADAIRSANAH